MNIKIDFMNGTAIIKENIKHFSFDNKHLLVKIFSNKDNGPFVFSVCDVANIEIENKKKDESPEDPADALPWSMNQYRTVVDAIIALASVSGDLSILANNPKLEMSKELREQLEELVYELKKFDESFTFEF